MCTLVDTIRTAECDELHCVIDSASAKYLCFTRIRANGTFALNVSDGVDLWMAEFDLDELDAHRDLSNLNMDAYLLKLRKCIKENDVEVSPVGVKVILTLGSGASCISFDLYEAKAIDRKTELQHILFRLAEMSSDLEKKLVRAKKETEQARTAGASPSKMGDLGAAKNSKGQAKAAPKMAGMSTLNPGSKKRKTARGVQFD